MIKYIKLIVHKKKNEYSFFFFFLKEWSCTVLIKIFWVSLFKGTCTFLFVDHCENGIDKKCPYQWCEFAMQASISLRNRDFWCEYWLTSIISASIWQHPLLGIIAEQASTQLWKLIVSLYTDSWINNVKSSERFYLSRLHSHKTLAQSPSITTHGDKYYHWLYSGNL